MEERSIMNATVQLSFDVDAPSSRITQFQRTTPTPMSRGEFAVGLGMPRVLDVLDTHHMPATFLIPGHNSWAGGGSLAWARPKR